MSGVSYGVPGFHMVRSWVYMVLIPVSCILTCLVFCSGVQQTQLYALYYQSRRNLNTLCICCRAREASWFHKPGPRLGMVPSLITSSQSLWEPENFISQTLKLLQSLFAFLCTEMCYTVLLPYTVKLLQPAFHKHCNKCINPNECKTEEEEHVCCSKRKFIGPMRWCRFASSLSISFPIDDMHTMIAWLTDLLKISSCVSEHYWWNLKNASRGLDGNAAVDLKSIKPL